MSNILNKFEKFNETIFFKNYNELEKKVEALKKLHDKYPKNEKISQTLKLCELGLKGEKEIEYELKHANIGMYVLHDINLNSNGNTAQIDYMVITPAYIYFIECKNLIGNITVNNDGQFIREYTYNNKITRESMYSPLTQAERHIDIYKKIWNLNHNGLFYKIFNINLDNIVKPLVVMANSKNILDLKEAPEEVKNKIVRADGLVNYIKKDIANYDKNLLLSQKNMESNATGIMERYNKDINVNYEEFFEKLVSEHEKNESMAKKRKELKEKLLKFRIQRHNQQKIPAYYVFNDKELELILEKLPKTLDELEMANILPKIKIMCHGKEIIDIINNIDK